MRANEGVESAVATARQYVAAAEAACDDLPPGAATDALRAAPGALLERTVAAADPRRPDARPSPWATSEPGAVSVDGGRWRPDARGRRPERMVSAACRRAVARVADAAVRGERLGGSVAWSTIGGG